MINISRRHLDKLINQVSEMAKKKPSWNVSYFQEIKSENSNYTFSVERYTEIERENRILLEKMSNIMQNPKPNLY